MATRILALLGPSGVGKTSLRRSLQQLDSRFVDIPAYTTRPQRSLEYDRVSVSAEEFTALENARAFLPTNELFGHRYATPRAPVQEALGKGLYPVLDWPIRLLSKLHEIFPYDVVAVYLTPPSIHELARRLSLDGRDR